MVFKSVFFADFYAFNTVICTSVNIILGVDALNYSGVISYGIVGNNGLWQGIADFISISENASTVKIRVITKVLPCVFILNPPFIGYGFAKTCARKKIGGFVE